MKSLITIIGSQEKPGDYRENENKTIKNDKNKEGK